MKYSNTIHRFFLLLFPFLLTGCYTQFQTYDDFPIEKDRYAGYYAWDGFERAEPARENETENNEQAYNNNNDETAGNEIDGEEYLDDELALEMNGIYFQDYETKRWYEEHYANKLFWEGYDEGYDDGYSDGWSDNYYSYSARYSINQHRYIYGYPGAFDYYSFYHYPAYGTALWFNYGGFPYLTFYTGFYGHWGIYDPFYSPYWGHPYYSYYGYYYGSYYGYAHSYNYYHRNIRYGRSADIYRTGPRNSGFANKSGDRNRPGLDRDTNTRGTGLTRTRSNNGPGIRGTGSTINRGSSGTLRSRGNTGSRGSSIGKGTTNPGNNRGRGSGSSIRNNRPSSGENGRSNARSRGSDSNLNNTTSRTYNIGSLGDKGRLYTIPTRKVSYPKVRNNDRRTNIGNFFRAPSNSRTIQRSTYGNSRSGYTTSPGSAPRINNRSTSTSRPSIKARSSSSSSRSSGTKSRSSGSSSSKKGSRGN